MAWLDLSPWVLGALALALLVFFDLGPPLAFNDDFEPAWSVRQLVAGHGFRTLPDQAALGLVQIVWAALVTFGHPDQRWLRLSLVPFALVSAAALYWLARRQGASRGWAAVAGAGLLCAPLYLGLATSFMTDVAYLALLLLAAVHGWRWVVEGRSLLACSVLVALASLQRQQGAALLLALTAGLALAARGRAVGRREWGELAGLWAAVALAQGLTLLLGLATPQAVGRLAGLSAGLGDRLQNPGELARALATAPLVGGLVALPFLAALAFAASEPRRWTWAALVPAAIALLAVGFAVQTSLHSAAIFPSNYWNHRGLNPLNLAGSKPALYPLAVYVGSELAAVAVVAVALVLRARDWSPKAGGTGGTFLVLVGLSQLLPVLVTGVWDRYYLPVVLPLLPVLAAMASRTARPRLASAWSVAALAAGLAAYAAGEQDYQAWQQARDQAAQLAYRTVAPERVDAGYEAYAVYVYVPTLERTGRLPGGLPASATGQVDLVRGPADPAVRLSFANADDTHPGIAYRSLAPGRVVLLKP
ncbi:MAG TPA: hypothetical protein VK131_05955 [Candidatus Acidoferrales bacterium]|nr:hypothetical protein [Candidatus Acidoferrales bacterium]